MQGRGFKVIKLYKDKAVSLPQRKTAYSAGYDIEAADDVILLPSEVTLVPTGLKVYMPSDEYLGIHIRSGLSIKKKLSLINGQGIIDADYIDNADNEGHIIIAIYNHGSEKVQVSKGDRIAQGIFYKYLKADYDKEYVNKIRAGGFGSTDK